VTRFNVRTPAAALLLAIVATLGCTALRAQPYPAKPVRMIMPFAAGAASDIVGRTLGSELAAQMGQSFVPDNRPGAGGSIGVAAAAKAEPDGYTVLLTSPSIALAPLLYPNVPFDPAKDFAPVARVGTIENVMVVHPSVPAKTLQEFIALARKYPGKLSFGSGGAGTTNHLANESLMYYEKLDMLHVPYKGAVLATLALMSGEVDEVVVGVAPALPLIKAGKVRPLVVLSESRVPVLPDVPTSTEAGVPKFKMSIWYGLFAPARTPADIVARLSRETLTALKTPELRDRMLAAGVNPWPGTPAELAALVREETKRYSEIIHGAHIKAGR
jgi:tripartite-type tricarboxylate transporter receptor subunit TctC